MNPALLPLTAPQVLSRQISLIVLHCSATPSGHWLRGNPRSPGSVRAHQVIDGWHRQRGFERSAAARQAFQPDLCAIGYHYVIDLDGALLYGRHLNEVGAHVAGHNAHSVGVCLVGGAETEARYTMAQWIRLAEMVSLLHMQLGIRPLTPTPDRIDSGGICGHRDLSPDANGDGRISPSEWLKTCPGFDVAAWLGRGMQPLAAQVCEVAL